MPIFQLLDRRVLQAALRANRRWDRPLPIGLEIAALTLACRGATVGSPPIWAMDLVRCICEAHGRPVPTFKWRRREKNYSTGHCSRTRIVVTTGPDPRKAKMTLLHELGHWIVGPEHWHDDTFWDMCLKLYQDNGISREEYLPMLCYAGARRALARNGWRGLWYAPDEASRPCPETGGYAPPPGSNCGIRPNVTTSASCGLAHSPKVLPSGSIV